MSSLLGLRRSKASVFDQNATGNSVTFDASVNEDHSGTSTTTDHPVENGSDITDHVREEPDTLTMNVIVSNHPIVLLNSLLGTPASTGGDNKTRAEDAYDFLRDLKKTKKAVGIKTTLRTYEDMQITAISVGRDSGRGNIVDMTLSFRKIIIAETETVAAPTRPVKPGTQSTGKKQKPPSSAATATKSQGLLQKTFNSVGKFFSTPAG